MVIQLGPFCQGLVAAQIIPAYGWRSMFQVAGIATLITLPLIFFFLAESLDFLLKRQPKGALVKVNAILSKMNRAKLSDLPLLNITKVEKPSVSSLLTPERRLSTLQLWLALFMAFASLYFLVTWIPKLASIAGLSLELAIYAGTIFNLGS